MYYYFKKKIIFICLDGWEIKGMLLKHLREGIGSLLF